MFEINESISDDLDLIINPNTIDDDSIIIFNKDIRNKLYSNIHVPTSFSVTLLHVYSEIDDILDESEITDEEKIKISKQIAKWFLIIENDVILKIKK